MNERILPSPNLHTLFVSRETSKCPLISDMIKLGQLLQELGLTDKETGSISLDYGKRLLINSQNVDIKKMTQQDIVEIVDYDPLKNIMMVIGLNDPTRETPVHWIIQKARHDINAILQLKSVSLSERFQKKLPTTEKETQPGTLERAKEILKTLQNGKTIVIKNQGILFAGINSKEIHEAIQRYLGVQK
ncbi:MAG TPA: class II aldolase/adducin family protein [Candidatus Thermoplasmatota archaeon]|nr:class II aldolase/adducin family protein [Candidatus Thermoplasmatota archaeon]